MERCPRLQPSLSHYHYIPFPSCLNSFPSSLPLLSLYLSFQTLDLSEKNFHLHFYYILIPFHLLLNVTPLLFSLSLNHKSFPSFGKQKLLILIKRKRKELFSPGKGKLTEENRSIVSASTLQELISYSFPYLCHFLFVNLLSSK